MEATTIVPLGSIEGYHIFFLMRIKLLGTQDPDNAAQTSQNSQNHHKRALKDISKQASAFSYL